MAFNWQITVGNPTLQAGQYFAVKYKKLPSGSWIDFLPNPTTNTFTIPTLEQGQYTAEIRVYCLDGSLSTPTYINNNCGVVIPIPVNCVFSAWSVWSVCSVNNTKTRTRTIITPASNGGTCVGDLSETVSCLIDLIPIETVVSIRSSDFSETAAINCALNLSTPCDVVKYGTSVGYETGDKVLDFATNTPFNGNNKYYLIRPLNGIGGDSTYVLINNLGVISFVGLCINNSPT